MLPDTSTGRDREVDIVIEGAAAGYPILICIECCDSNRTATVEWVDEMLGKHTNLPTDKLVLVSRSGFTDAAEKKARHGGAESLTFEEAEVVEWTRVVHRMSSLILDASLARSFVMPGLMEDVKVAKSLRRDQLVCSKNGEWAVRVEKFEDFVLTNRTLRAHTVDTVEVGGEYGWTIGIPLAEGTYTIDQGGNQRELDAVSVVVLVKRRHLPIQLRPAIFRGIQVTYGEATGELGRATVAVLEREGRLPQAILIHNYEGRQEISQLPDDEVPTFDPASQEAMQALIGHRPDPTPEP